MRDQSVTALSGLRIRCCCELWYSKRSSSDSSLLWLWCRPAAIAPVQPLAWEPPYVTTSAGLKRQQTNKQTNKNPLINCLVSWALEYSFSGVYLALSFTSSIRHGMTWSVHWETNQTWCLAFFLRNLTPSMNSNFVWEWSQLAVYF